MHLKPLVRLCNSLTKTHRGVRVIMRALTAAPETRPSWNESPWVWVCNDQLQA